MICRLLNYVHLDEDKQMLYRRKSVLENRGFPNFCPFLIEQRSSQGVREFMDISSYMTWDLIESNSNLFKVDSR